MVARDDPDLRAIALLAAPSRTIRRILEFQRRVRRERHDDTKRDSALAALARGADSAAATPGRLAYLYDYDPLATARRVRTAVLILHGATDLGDGRPSARAVLGVPRGRKSRRDDPRLLRTNHLFLDDPSGVYSGYRHAPLEVVKPEVLADWVAERLGRE